MESTLRDQQRFESFARAHSQTLLQFARRLCGQNGIDPEDLVQETFQRALQWFDKLEALPSSARWSWLCTSLNNRFLDVCRKRRTELLGATGLRLVQPESFTPGETCEELWAGFSPEQFRAAVERLGRKHRDVYELHVAGIRYREIAQRLGVPIGTVGAWLNEARRELRQLLTSSGGNDGSQPS